MVFLLPHSHSSPANLDIQPGSLSHRCTHKPQMRFFLCFIYRRHIPDPPSNHAFSLYLFSYLVFSNHHTLITTLHSVTRKISTPVQANVKQYNRRVVSATFSVHSTSRLFFRSCLLVYFFIYFHHIERCF